MSSKIELELFQKWQDLNEKVGASFGQFDFETIKKIRKEQRAIEDQVYVLLLESAPENIKKYLPEDCGEMEIGYNFKDKVFYYLMADPDQEENDDAPIIVLAITIDTNRKVEIIRDFKAE